jgi:hypothetical protein
MVAVEGAKGGLGLRFQVGAGAASGEVLCFQDVS